MVHVQRTAAWVNYLYLAWLLVSRGLPPIRAVVNMRRWLGKPWRKVAQRGDLEVRFTYARRNGGSALVFLQQTALGRARGKERTGGPLPCPGGAGAQERPASLPRPRAVRLGEVERPPQARLGRLRLRQPRGPGLPPLGAGVLAQPQARPVPGGRAARADGVRRRQPRRLRRGAGPQGARRPPRPPGAGDPGGVRAALQAAGADHRRDAARPHAAPDHRADGRRGAARRRSSWSARPGGTSTPSPPASTPRCWASWPR